MFDDAITLSDCGSRVQIDAPQSKLLAMVVPRKSGQWIPRRLRSRTIWYLAGEQSAVITNLKCQACSRVKHADSFNPKSLRRAQYSLLHSLWPGYIRRTERSIWCTQCAVEDQLMQGNFPDGYCFRIRATLEICHQDRVAAKLFAVHDSNALFEQIPLSSRAAMDVAEQLRRYWQDAVSSDGQSNIFHSDHVSTDDDSEFAPGGPESVP